MGNIVSNLLITVINDWHILLSVVLAGYWFSRQTKKALQKEIQKEIKGVNARIDSVNARIDEHEKSVSDKFSSMQARIDDHEKECVKWRQQVSRKLDEIETKLSFEKRISKLEDSIDERQQSAT